MGLLLFLVKPFLYVAAFWIALAVFRHFGPVGGFGGRPLPGWLLVGLASLGRLVIGIPVGTAAVFLAGNDSRLLMFALIVPVGFVLWLVTARLAFPRAPMRSLAFFALGAEVVSGGIDYWAWDDVSGISFC